MALFVAFKRSKSVKTVVLLEENVETKQNTNRKFCFIVGEKMFGHLRNHVFFRTDKFESQHISSVSEIHKSKSKTPKIFQLWCIKGISGILQKCCLPVENGARRSWQKSSQEQCNFGWQDHKWAQRKGCQAGEEWGVTLSVKLNDAKHIQQCHRGLSHLDKSHLQVFCLVKHPSLKNLHPSFWHMCHKLCCVFLCILMQFKPENKSWKRFFLTKFILL